MSRSKRHVNTQTQVVVLMLSIEVHPRLVDDLPELVQSYLESEGLLHVRSVVYGQGNMLDTSDLPYVRTGEFKKPT